MRNYFFGLVFFVMAGCTGRDNYGVLDFSKGELPSIVATKNLSGVESWGRWTDGTPTIFVFDKGLPENFRLTLEVNRSFGPNVGKDFIVRVGNQSYNFSGPAPVRDGEPNLTFSFDFKNVPNNINQLEIVAPYPSSPKQYGGSNDSRLLGLGLKGLEISPIPTL